MSRRDDWDDRGRDDYDDRRSGGQRSGAVTGAAVINFIAGGLILVLAICALVGTASGRGAGPGQAQALGMILAVGMIGWSVCCIIAGVGIIGRKNGSRIFALVLAGLAIPFGLYFLWTAIMVLTVGLFGPLMVIFLVAFLTALVFLLHTIWNFTVLLNSRNASEFR